MSVGDESDASSTGDENAEFLDWFKEQLRRYPIQSGVVACRSDAVTVAPTSDEVVPETMREIREARLREERERSPNMRIDQARLRQVRELAKRGIVCDPAKLSEEAQADPTLEPSFLTSEKLSIGGVMIRGLHWGLETHAMRYQGIQAEMLRCPDVFTLKRMQRTDRTSNSSVVISDMERDVSWHIERPNVVSFKVGITWNPPYRWIHPKYGYASSGYHHMVLLATDPDARVCGMYESMMIRIFGEYDVCDNTRQGDDNRQEVSPMYVYLALR